MGEGPLGGAAPAPCILAVESATQAIGVALLRGGALVVELTHRDARIAAERLLPAIERVFETAGSLPEEVAAYAVSIGPGSFTGLRVGLATVKGLALADGRPVVAVPTLAALACGALGAPGAVAALLGAQRGEVYAAAWAGLADAARGVAPVVAESVYRAEALAAALPAACTLAVGEGAEDAARTLCAARRDLRPLPGAPLLASAARVGRLAARGLAAGAARPAAELVPRYLRRAEAEARRTGQPLEEGGGRAL